MASEKKIVSTSSKKIVSEGTANFKAELLSNQGSLIQKKLEGYRVFEVVIGQPISFKLIADINSTINPIATQTRFFLAKQTLKNFGKHEWIPFDGITNKENIYEFINKLSKKQIANGEFTALSDNGTKKVGKNYLQNFEVKKINNKTAFREVKTSFMLTASDIGKGFWVEAFNYKPEWKQDQGVIIVGVENPKVISFYAEKRTKQEKTIKGITKDKIETSISNELVYGDILDIHINIHTRNKDFPVTLSVINTDGGETILHTHTFSEKSFLSKPTSIGNILTIEEINLLPQWIAELKHEVNTTKNFVIRLFLDFSDVKDVNGECSLDNITKEISFTTNYKDDWSIEEDETEWVAQIAEIQEATLVSQKNEECGYTEISITGLDQPFLKQNDDGCLDNHPTSILEYVAGNKNNTQTITIDLKDVETTECQEAGFDNTEDSSKSHKNNVFNTNHIEKIEHISQTGVWKIIKDKNHFESIQPYQEQSKSGSSLTFKIAYPYNAYNEHVFLLKYLSFQVAPVSFPIVIQTCRYVRTPIFKIHPDTQIAFHFMYDPVKELYFRGEEVNLLSLNANAFDYTQDLVDWLYKPIKGVLEFFDVDLGKKVYKQLDDYVKKPIPQVKMGFHMKADGVLIPYSDMQPYKAYFYYQMFMFSLLPVVFELLLAYLTRGKSVQTKLGRAAKKFKKIRKRVKDALDDVDVEFVYPKISTNFGMYKQQEENGEIATIYQYVSQAKPLLGLTTTKVFDKEIPTIGSVKFTAIFKGQIDYDINLKYNDLTGEFTLTENVKDQTGGSGIPFKNGDIVRHAKNITCKVKADLNIDIKGEFTVIPYLLEGTYHAKGNIKGVFHGEIGAETVLGYDKGEHLGPYTQKTTYFTGVSGKYKIEAEVSWGWFGWKTPPKPKWVKVELMKPIKWQEPKEYLLTPFRMLAGKNKDKNDTNYEYITPKAPIVNFNTHDN